jgi:hypothetical protein
LSQDQKPCATKTKGMAVFSVRVGVLRGGAVLVK